jgi:hypothetical protein
MSSTDAPSARAFETVDLNNVANLAYQSLHAEAYSSLDRGASVTGQMRPTEQLSRNADDIVPAGPQSLFRTPTVTRTEESKPETRPATKPPATPLPEIWDPDLSPIRSADKTLPGLRIRELESKPARPVETEQTLKFRDTNIVMRSRDGVPFSFKIGDEEWKSTDGENWNRQGAEPRNWRGRVRFDDDGNFVQEGTSFGVTITRRADGSRTRSIISKDGNPISMTDQANGHKEFVGTETWSSRDSVNWTNGKDTWRGQLQIDNEGIYWRERLDRDANNRWEVANRSRESEQIRARMAEMATNYGVSFGSSGTEIDYDYHDPQDNVKKNVKVSYRSPTLDELQTLENCLQRYSHLARDNNGKPDFGGMRFSFISPNGDGNKVSLWGWYSSNLNGVSQIHFGPRNAAMTNGWEAFEGTALHEIAHHLQHKRWTHNFVYRMPAQVSGFFGFERQEPSGTYRLRDKEGGLWERDDIRARDPATNKWRFESRWYPVTGAGNVIKEASRARTTEQMFQNLPEGNRPCTRYFTHPQEAHAEAIAMLIQNPKMLYERNYRLYEAARQWDQTDINSRYGTTTVDGKTVPRMIRGSEGTIVPNNHVNRERRRQMEQSWRASPQQSAMHSAAIDWDQTGRDNCPCCA